MNALPGPDQEILLRPKIIAALAVAALTAPLGSASAVPPIAGGALASSNIDLVANIPFAGAIGAKLVGDHMYVTGGAGLTIYDVSKGLPIPTGALALPHFENEQVDGNGDVLVISADFFVLGNYANMVALIDTTNKNAPILASLSPTGDGHTGTCVQDCKYLWLSGGDVWDISDPAAPVRKGRQPGGYVHNWNIDSAGYAWGDGSRVLDLNGYGPHNLTSPTNTGASGYFGWHNSIRPYADEVTASQFIDTQVDRGEVVFGAGEDLYDFFGVEGNCAGQDRVTATHFRKLPDGGYKLNQLDTWDVALNGTELDHKPTAATFCSSHWLDVHNDILAVGWYEQGTRILDVSDPRNMRQIGYFLPVETQAWGAYFKEIPGDGLYIYSIDLIRGIDVLKFSGSSSDAEVKAPRLNPTNPAFAPDTEFGWNCRVPVAKI
jgi:hypothetical protein